MDALPHTGVKVSKSITRLANTSVPVAEHLEVSRLAAAEKFEECLNILLSVARDEHANAGARIRAAMAIIDLGRSQTETQVETTTTSAHLDAIRGLAQTFNPQLGR